ncbi:uncharacterized protein DUF2637 [Prauserella shujinwangii]|uniref:Uncharacterized protein DUF2637 n=1 Tax=Prauserella shujinwangii TaxID=1453103 RepID=A0A2T0LXF2_9PSEU|nr:DUF2637 domain-containing protein [Prauserella shujinwangii]PRX48702.1 uncharacterized protein DUF2637 [Prauserella shujinwangii]
MSALQAERATRTAGLVSGALVALVAAIASYTHMRELAAAHGEAWLAFLVPLSVDGLLVVASLVIVNARRSRGETPWLAWTALIVGVLVSLAANVAAAEPDLVSRLVAAWPPLAFAVSFELVLRLVRQVPHQADNLATHRVPGLVENPAPEVGPPGEPEPHHQVAPAPDTSLEDIGNQVHQPGEKKGATRPRTTRRKARQAPGRQVDDALVDRATDLVAAGKEEGRQVGRARLARELCITENQARQVLRQVADRRHPPPIHLVTEAGS